MYIIVNNITDQTDTKCRIFEDLTKQLSCAAALRRFLGNNIEQHCPLVSHRVEPINSWSLGGDAFVARHLVRDAADPVIQIQYGGPEVSMSGVKRPAFHFLRPKAGTELCFFFFLSCVWYDMAMGKKPVSYCQC